MQNNKQIISINSIIYEPLAHAKNIKYFLYKVISFCNVIVKFLNSLTIARPVELFNMLIVFKLL